MEAIIGTMRGYCNAEFECPRHKLNRSKCKEKADKFVIYLPFCYYIGMNIQIRSKTLAAQFESKTPWACISISSHEGQWPILKTDNLVKVLRLAFPDYEFARPGGITAEQAQQIIEFVNEVVPQIETLLIHCEYGASRSPAVGAAISKILGKDDKVYFEQYTPNNIVYKTILKQAGLI